MNIPPKMKTREFVIRCIVIFLLAVVLAGIAAKLYPREAADENPGCDPRDDSCARGCP